MTNLIVPVTGSVISGPDVQAAIWFLGRPVSGACQRRADRRGLRPSRPDLLRARRRTAGICRRGGTHRRARHGRGAAPASSPRLRRHLRHRAVPHLAFPGRVRAVRRRGRSARPGPYPGPRHPTDRRISPRWPRPLPGTRSRSWPRRPNPRSVAWPAGAGPMGDPVLSWPARAGAGRRTGGDTGTSGARRPAGPGTGWRGRSR
jgi:hypothetical protein